MKNENRLLVGILIILTVSVLLTGGLAIYLVITREQQDTDLAVPEASHTPPTLVHEQESTVSATSEPRIAFISTHEDETAVYVTTADDWRPQRISMADQITCTCPSWSPDGQRVAYLAKESNEGYDVWVATADGTEHIRVNDAISATLPVVPTWSPDGTLLAFVAEGELAEWDSFNSVVHVARTDGTGIERGIPLPGHILRLAWSPTGDDMLFVSTPTTLDAEHTSQTKFHVYVMSSAGEDVIQIASEAQVADWSPDGKEIVVGDYGTRSILVTNRDQKSRHIAQLGREYPREVVWSPDGARIAVITTSDANPLGLTSTLHIIVLKTGKIITVIEDNDTLLFGPSWSADGKNLLFGRGVIQMQEHQARLLSSDLWVYDVESGQLEQLTQSEEREGMAVWSP